MLVTDDVVRHVDSQSLQLRFLPPPARPQSTESPPVLALPCQISTTDATSTTQPPSPVKEVVYDDDREAMAVARAVALVERDQEQRAQQLAALKDAERASELAAAREAFAFDRARLEHELASSKAKSEEVERERLERRAREQDESKAAKREVSQRQTAATADEALEVRRLPCIHKASRCRRL